MRVSEEIQEVIKRLPIELGHLIYILATQEGKKKLTSSVEDAETFLHGIDMATLHILAQNPAYVVNAEYAAKLIKECPHDPALIIALQIVAYRQDTEANAGRLATLSRFLSAAVKHYRQQSLDEYNKLIGDTK